MAELELEGVGKCYRDGGSPDVWAVRQLTLTAERGELLVLVGPSGAGKTTVLRLVAGLETATEGCIRLGGRAVDSLPPQDRDVAMVFQNHALYPHLTGYENLALGLVLRKTARAEVTRRVREVAAVLGLEGCLERRPAALSGGERQRVALGRALVRKPRVCLLDEPFSNLDAPRRLQIREELVGLQHRFGLTLLCATHDQQDALAMGDRVAVLKEGRLQQVDEPLKLYHHPANLFVAGFLGTPSMNFIEGRLRTRGESLWFESQDVRADGTASLAFQITEPQDRALVPRVGAAVVCGLRPEQVQCFRGASPERPVGTGLIERIEAAGADTCLRLRLREETPLTLVARVASRSSWQRGERVAVTLDSRPVLFFDPRTGERVA